MNLLRFFEALAQNLQALQDEASFDLTTIQELTFDPGFDGEWWATTPEQFAQMWMYQGKPTVAYCGHRSDFWDL